MEVLRMRMIHDGRWYWGHEKQHAYLCTDKKISLWYQDEVGRWVQYWKLTWAASSRNPYVNFGSFLGARSMQDVREASSCEQDALLSTGHAEMDTRRRCFGATTAALSSSHRRPNNDQPMMMTQTQSPTKNCTRSRRHCSLWIYATLATPNCDQLCLSMEFCPSATRPPSYFWQTS